MSKFKKFEEQVEKGLNQLPDIIVERIPDQQSRYKGSANCCDYRAYKKPLCFYIECKTVLTGASLPFSNITEAQWEGLLSRSRVSGCVAGVICWFISRGTTKFFPITFLEILRKEGKKSVRWDCDDLCVIEIPGVKKRVYYDYDFTGFIEKATKY